MQKTTFKNEGKSKVKRNTIKFQTLYSLVDDFIYTMNFLGNLVAFLIKVTLNGSSLLNQ